MQAVMSCVPSLRCGDTLFTRRERGKDKRADWMNETKKNHLPFLGMPEDVPVLYQPLDNIYLQATAAMLETE